MRIDHRFEITLTLSPAVLQRVDRVLAMIGDVERLDKLSAEVAREESELKAAVKANPLPPT